MESRLSNSHQIKKDSGSQQIISQKQISSTVASDKEGQEHSTHVNYKKTSKTTSSGVINLDKDWLHLGDDYEIVSELGSGTFGTVV